MTIYNKLIRDNVPESIEKSGRSYNIKRLSDGEFIDKLKVKLQEEVKEYLTTDTDVQAIEELADILEVIHALAMVHGQTITEVEEARRAKAVDRGAFKEKIFLIDVEDEPVRK